MSFESKELTHDEKIEQLLERSTLITGIVGQGTTSAAVCLAYDIKQKTNRPVITIGMHLGLKADVFGEFQELDEAAFVDQLKKMTDVANKSSGVSHGEEAYKLLKQNGVDIYGATLIFGDALEFFDRRKWQSKLNVLSAKFMSVYRHYRVTPILIAPEQDDLDPRVLRLMFWKGPCFYNCSAKTTKLRVADYAGIIDFTLTWDMEKEPPCHSMFESYNLVGVGA
jgi:hypothetical protein